MSQPPAPPDLPSGLGHTHGADHRLVALLADLRGNVAACGLPSHAHNEIGQFIEILTEAFGAAVGAGHDVNVTAWHTYLEGAHAATYNPLYTAFGHRNMASHANRDQVLLTDATVQSDLAAVERLLPVVTADLDRTLGLDFLAHVERHAETRRWRRTTSEGYQTVTSGHSLPQAAGPIPTVTLTQAPATGTKNRLRLVPWLVAFVVLLVLTTAGFFLLRGEAHASAADLISEWQIGARWVYRSAVDVPADYPDEHRAMEAFTERELVDRRETKVGTELHFVTRGGDDDNRERKTLWRVHGDCIESLNPKRRTTYERACLDPTNTNKDLVVFKSVPPSWEIRLKPGVGPTLLSWRNKRLGYTKYRDLKRADVAGRTWGDPNMRPITCDWRLSSEDANANYRLGDGLACSSVEVQNRRVRLRCRAGVVVPEFVARAGRVKLYADSRGTEWLAVVGGGQDALQVDTCNIDSRGVHCQRHSGPAGSQDWSVWTVSGGGQCRFRIAERRDRTTNHRRVASWALEPAGMRRLGGTLPVTTEPR